LVRLQVKGVRFRGLPGGRRCQEPRASGANRHASDGEGSADRFSGGEVCVFVAVRGRGQG